MFAFWSLLKRKSQDHSGDRSTAERVQPLSFGELLAASSCPECCVLPLDYLMRYEFDGRPDAPEGERTVRRWHTASP